MSDTKGKSVQIRRKTGGSRVTADPALAGELVARGGWELVEKAKPAPKAEDKAPAEDK